MCFACMSVNHPCLCGARGSQKKVVDALELWAVVSFHVDARNHT